jgi:hypothetical protein
MMNELIQIRISVPTTVTMTASILIDPTASISVHGTGCAEVF